LRSDREGNQRSVAVTEDSLGIHAVYDPVRGGATGRFVVGGRDVSVADSAVESATAVPDCRSATNGDTEGHGDRGGARFEFRPREDAATDVP
jgi:hypothetical protein